MHLRIININKDLKPVKVDELSSCEDFNDPRKLIPIQRIGYSFKIPKEDKVLAYYANNEINYSRNGSLFDAFLQAYNNHEDITLVPDDVWLTILFQFSKYVNANVEKLRSLLVSHEGKKELTIRTENELSESEWEEFFDLMIGEIKKNTKDEIVNKIQSNFSTTGLIEKMISTATVMESVKSFFSFGRIIPMCGIKNVCFAGTLEDWQSILTKLHFLKKYDINGQWNEYITNLIPIIEQFINTYNYKVDVDFWDKVMNIRHGRLGSGSTDYVSGWILAFYGQKGEIDVDEIDKDYTVNVPVKIENKITNTTKMIRLRATFAGLNKTNGSYRPQLSMIVCELKKDNSDEEYKDSDKEDDENNYYKEEEYE